MKRPLLADLAILIAWMLRDVLLHRLFLAPLYDASPGTVATIRSDET